MKSMATPFTVRDYELLPEGFRAQLVKGMLVKDETPTYGHQGVVVSIFDRVRHFVPPGRVLLGPVGVTIDELNVYAPDLAVFREDPPPDGRRELVPLVVFEVLSPSTSRRDRATKAPRYLAAGVEEVWLVDPSMRQIEVRAATWAVEPTRGCVMSRAIEGFSLEAAELMRGRVG